MSPNTSRPTGESSCQETMAGTTPDNPNTRAARTPAPKTSWWGFGRGNKTSVGWAKPPVSVRRAACGPRDRRDWGGGCARPGGKPDLAPPAPARGRRDPPRSRGGSGGRPHVRGCAGPRDHPAAGRAVVRAPDQGKGSLQLGIEHEGRFISPTAGNTRLATTYTF